jgi:exosortase/archaeosortase family protein
VLTGNIFLRSNYSRICLIVLTVPIAILKNAVRIVTISWLGTYVSTDFFFGTLHRHGGLPFSLLALALMLPLVYVLRRLEARGRNRVAKEEPAMLPGVDVLRGMSKT